MQKKGHEIFVSLRKDNTFENRFKFLARENLLFLSPKNSLDVISAIKISKILRKNRLDIVHAHLARDYLSASIAARLNPSTKLIITRHVMFPISKFYSPLLSNVSKAIAVSNAVESNLQKIFSEEKIAQISNGVNLNKWIEVDKKNLSSDFRNKNNIPLHAKLVGTIGELKKLKGQEDFIKAASKISAKFPDTFFIIVGEDNSKNEAFKKSLQKMASNLGLKDKMYFINWVDETASLLSAIDIFVSPSHSESFGLAILDAMASGKAIVAAATDGAKELLTDEKDKTLSPIGEPNKLADNIISLLKDKALLENLGKLNQKRAFNKFSLERMIKQTEEIYYQDKNSAHFTK